jgi:putative hydrolase of HD superfamily
MFKDERFRKTIDFIIEIDKSKEIFRQNYLVNTSRNENDAEHSWHMAIMAFLLSEYIEVKVDMLKVIKMILLHDIIEIYAGDTYCYDEKGLANKPANEEEAAKKYLEFFLKI